MPPMNRLGSDSGDRGNNSASGGSHGVPMAYAVPVQPRSTVSEIVQVPTELASFASDPQFQQILLKVKEQSKINYIAVNRNTERTAAETILIDAPTSESAMLARKLVEIHFKQHLKIQAAETRLQRVQTDLFSVQGEMASGMIVDFTIDPDLVGNKHRTIVTYYFRTILLLSPSGITIKEKVDTLNIPS